MKDWQPTSIRGAIPGRWSCVLLPGLCASVLTGSRLESWRLRSEAPMQCVLTVGLQCVGSPICDEGGRPIAAI
jgi:hypothetical protein